MVNTATTRGLTRDRGDDQLENRSTAKDCDSPWLTPPQAAKRIGTSVQFIYDSCAAGGMKHVRLGGKRNIRIRIEDLDRWMENNEIENT